MPLFGLVRLLRMMPGVAASSQLLQCGMPLQHQHHPLLLVASQRLEQEEQEGELFP